MNHLKYFNQINESLNFNPRIISDFEFNSMVEPSLALRFSSEDTSKLLVNSRGISISWEYPRLLKNKIMGYFSNSPTDEIEIKFVTKFEVKRFMEEEFIYFEINFGYRNKNTDWREYLNLPTDKKVQGVMEIDEFLCLLENPKVWKDYCVSESLKQIGI